MGPAAAQTPRRARGRDGLFGPPNGERLPGVPEKEEEKKGFPVLLVLGGLAVVGIAVYYFYFRKKT